MGWWTVERDDFKGGYWSRVEIPTQMQMRLREFRGSPHFFVLVVALGGMAEMGRPELSCVVWLVGKNDKSANKITKFGAI